MTKSVCRIDDSKDLLLVSHGLTGHRINWLRLFLERAKIQKRVIHLLVERENSQEYLLAHIRLQFENNLCIHLFDGLQDEIYAEVLKLRSLYPEILVVISEAEEWYSLILKLRHNIRVLFMRPYLQEYSWSGLRNYLVKFLVASYLFTVRDSRIGLLAIPGDRPRIFPTKWVDELGSRRNISNHQASIVLSEIKNEISLPDNVGIVLVPGFITKRKNPEMILEAFDNFIGMNVSGDFALVFAGKIDDECKAIFEKSEYQFAYFLDRYLTEQEYSGLLKESSVVVLVYDNRASSGVVVDCIEISTRVILTGDGRWKNLFGLYPKSIVKGSKNPSRLAQQLNAILVSPEGVVNGANWRGNRADVLEFLLD
jgi:hypothetical protein